MMRHFILMCGLMMVVGGWATSVLAADAPTRRGGSIDSIEADIREIERLLHVNRQRQDELAKQTDEVNAEYKKAQEALEGARQAMKEAREKLTTANSGVVSAQSNLAEVEKMLLESMRAEPGWKMTVMQLQGAEQDWQVQRSRVLEKLAEDAEYKSLQSLLKDARQRADAREGSNDPSVRLAAGETARNMESQIVKMETQALAEDQAAAEASKKLEAIHAERERLQQAQSEQVKQKPEYQQAARELEKARSQVAQAQKDHDQARLEQARAETGASRAKARVQTTEAAVIKAKQEQKRQEDLQTTRRRDLFRARQGWR